MPGTYRAFFVIYSVFAVLHLGYDTRALSGRPVTPVRPRVDRDTPRISNLGLASVDTKLFVLSPGSKSVCDAQEAPVSGHLPITRSISAIRSDRKRQELVLSLIRYRWKDLGYEIVFLGPRSGYRAMTLSDRRRIEIYARPGDSPMALAYDVAHELGHAFDLEFNNYERRGQWRKMRGISLDTPWFGCNRCPDYSTPAGDFAETFALLLLGPGNYHSLIAPQPTREQAAELAAFCHLESVRYSDIWHGPFLDADPKPASLSRRTLSDQ